MVCGNVEWAGKYQSKRDAFTGSKKSPKTPDTQAFPGILISEII